MEPSLSTLKRLFAASGNRCAFLGCSAPIVEDSGTVTGIICHIKARAPGGPRYDPKQTEQDRHGFTNLVLMCARHSKLIDSEPKQFTPEVLTDMKETHERSGSIDLLPGEAQKAQRLLEDYKALYNINTTGHVMIDSPGGIQAGKVVIETRNKTVRFAAPAGTIAADRLKRNYIKHLIDRYHKYAAKQPGRDFSYGAVYDDIKREFGAKWDHVSVDRFDNLAAHIQRKIDRTMIGRVNSGKGQRSYSTYEDYLAKYEKKVE